MEFNAFLIIQDSSLRPGFGYEPAIVGIDLMVRSMGSVSEIEMVRNFLFGSFYCTSVIYKNSFNKNLNFIRAFIQNPIK